MRFVQLGLIVCLTALRPIQGSRLSRLEEDVDALKRFMFGELLSIRDQVKDISIRVDNLENATVTQDPRNPNQYIDIHSYNIRDETGTWNNEASHVVIAEVQNMRKAYANDKKDLHQLKQNVKGQLRELEHKITSHMHNLTADVQQNIEYIHENISLANVTLSEVINGSISNVIIFSDNMKKEIKNLFVNTSQQLTLQFNQTESKIKQNISATYRQNEENLERFMTLADRNVSQMILKADNLVNDTSTTFSEIPREIFRISLELQSVNHTIRHVEEKLTHELESTSINLQKQISILFTCSEDFIANNGTIQYGYYYPCTKDIRLANASPYGSNGIQGRLEVRHNIAWGTVCDDSFEYYVGEPHITNNVNVVCRMFGFRECEVVTHAGLGLGSGDIWMNNVRCEGDERSFLDCPHPGWGVEDCGHGEDVGFHLWN